MVAWHFASLQGALYGNQPVIVVIQLYVSRWRGDVDNHAKMILDAMTKARVWEDDRCVRHLTVEVNEVPKGEEFSVIVADFLSTIR